MLESRILSLSMEVAKEVDLSTFVYNSTIRITLPTEEYATIMKESIDVDKELQPDKVLRVLTVEADALVVTFKAINAKMLRVAISSFFDMATVAAKTLLEFGL